MLKTRSSRCELQVRVGAGTVSLVLCLSLKYAHFTNQDSHNGVCIRAVPLYATVLPSQAGIMREQRLRQDLHRQMEETKEEMKARVRGRGGRGLLVADRVSLQLQIESFQTNERDLTQALRVVRESFTEAKHEAQREVARFSEERARLQGQVGPSASYSN